MTGEAKPMARWKMAFIWLVLLGAFATLLALGTWQVQRLAWKEKLLADIDRNLASDPVPIKDIIIALEQGDDFEYRPVTLTGIFDHDKERHFFATHKGRVGYYIYTPFAFDGGVVFINRGFADFDLKDAKLRAEGQVGGTVSVTGLARKMLNKKPSRLVPDNEPGNNVFYWKDLREMANSAGLNYDDPELMKFFIDADGSPNPGHYPVGGVTLIDLPNNHLQYALTWYGLAAALVFIVGVFVLRRKQST